MAKQLNVSLAVNADTSQAKQQIQGLLSDLNRLSSTGNIKDLNLTPKLTEAKMAAKQLETQLNQAFNADIGQLDLNKLNMEFQKSGMTLADYGRKLSMLGPAGDEAFLKIAQSIAETEMPLRRSNSLLKEFGTTLMNTARWQISSSILHGFMGAIQGAYGYAQDLNESLNNIRIVTGQSSEEMAAFAERANKAAKALSTTTTEYTNASLIYYQQGLSDSEVQERTDVTIKMANVAGQSAEIVSDQMTAVWNNFYDGSKSLEYYADVMTALGAATASSTDEIAGGLEKFAAIGETIGLSYEYAASALATITSNTRQSEEVVGTALKTIFARIQGLKLGETLEDGVSLNKYSEALSKVGISIFEQNGELKAMDNILNEMGAKWDTLSKAQQTALAQTVAGVRQYTQLVALMENWNNGDNDSMMANLDTAYGSSGALQEQADIYAESWEASKDRVTASLEGIYDSLINDEFFIDLNNTLAKSIGAIEKLVDSLGGMSGVLGMIGVLATRIFQGQISQGINNAFNNFKVFTGAAKQGMETLQASARQYAREMTAGLVDSPAIQAQRDHLERTFIIQEKLKNSVKGLTDEQVKASQAVAETAKQYSKMAVEAGKAAEEAEESFMGQKLSSSNKVGAGAARAIDDSVDISTGLGGADLIREAKNVVQIGESMGSLSGEVNQVNAAIKEYAAVLRDSGASSEQIAEKAQNLRQALENISSQANSAGQTYTAFQNSLGSIAEEVVEAQYNFTALQSDVDENKVSFESLGPKIMEVSTNIRAAGIDLGDFSKLMDEYEVAMKSGSEEQKKTALQNLKKGFQDVKITTEQSEKAILDHAKSLQTNQKAFKGKEKAMKADVKAARESAQATKNQGVAAEEAAKKIANLDAELKKAQTAAKSFGSGVTTGLQAVSSLAMGINSLSSAWDTINNPDLSTFEKITSVLMSMGFAIPGLISGFKGLGTAFLDIRASLGGSYQALLANALGLDATTLATKNAQIEQIKYEGILKGKLVTQTADTLASIEDAAAKTLEAEAQEEVNEEKAKDSALTLTNIALRTMENMALAGGTAAKIAQTAAQWALNRAMSPFVALLLAALAAMLPYIAAAAALTLVIGGAVYALDSENRALKEAEEREQRTADAAKRVAQEIEEIQGSLNKVSSGVDTLKQLEQGTLEWYQALLDINGEVEKLIKLFPELVKFGMITNTNGLLGITEEGMNYVNQSMEKLLYISSQSASEARIDNIDTKILNKNAYGYGNYEYAKNAQGEYLKHGDDLFSNKDVALEAYKNVYGEYAADITAEAALEHMKEHKEVIIEINDLLLERQQIEEQILNTQKAYYGSTRTTSQWEELANQSQANTITGSGNSMKLNYTKDGESKSFNMNQSFNYNAWGNTIPKEIEDFMRIQGGVSGETNVEYVAQRNGNLVLKIDEKEVKFSQEEVYAALDKYYDEEFKKNIVKKIEENVNSALGGGITLDFSQLSFEEVIDVDNLYAKIEDTLASSVDADKVKASTEKVFADIMNAYQVKDKEGNVDWNATSANLASDFTDINFDDARVSAYINLLNEGKISAAEFRAEMGELNALIRLDNMGSWFQGQAESLGLDAEAATEMQDYAKHLIEVSDELEGLSDSLATDADSAADLAVEITRMNKGIDTLADNFKDWNDILQKSSKGSAEYAKAMSGMKKAVADVIDVEEDMISSDFITKHSKEIQKAAKGDEKAIDSLRAAMDEEIIAQIKLDRPDLTNLDDLDLEVKNKLDEALKDLDVPDIEVGAILKDEDFLKAANNLVTESGMTADQANAYFAGIGYEPVYSVTDVESTGSMDMDSKTQTFLDNFSLFNGKQTIDMGPLGSWDIPILNPNITWHSETVKEPPTDLNSTIPLMAFSGDTTPPTIKGMRKKATGSQNNYSSSNKGGKAPGSGSKGGGGSKPKKAEKAKKSEIVERYKEIEDNLDDLRDTMEDTNKAADRLYGNARIKQMEKVNKMILKEIELTKQKKKEAQAYLKQDKIELDQAAAKAGVSLQYDENGNISNHTSEMEKLFNQLNSATEAANADGNADDAEKERIDKIQEKIDELKDAMKQYEDTRELIEDLDNELDDKFYEWQDNNYEQLNYKLEIDIELKDDDLQRLEYYLGKTEDDIFQRAEGAEIMTEQVSTYTDIMDRYTSQVKDLDAAYAAGEISQADYIEGLDQCKDELYNNLEALQDLDDYMMHYYGETLQMARDEIDDITEHMEHQTAVLDHYQSLMDIQGKSTDYNNMGIILEGKSSNIKSEMEVAKEEADWFMSEAIKQKDAYDKAMAAGNEEEAELYWQQYQDSLAAADEAQDEYLSKAEEYAESLKAILENSLNKYAQDLENALTGQFGSFDQMAASMERAASLQEEYLTATNKIYETNKLMNQAQQEIDKTSNTVAKAKLKSFIEETNQLQEKTKLSQFELEIQQAKYELLLAEIALEEAQSTKTNVRLQRDNEGNFGYVYTADAEAVSNAEQQLADAQNNLYNIGLEGANSYTEKYQQTLQEMYDTLTDLQQQYLSGAFESEEEYHRAVEAAKEYYYEKLGQYSDLYTIALGVDGNIRADAWSSDFEFMTRDAEEWQIAVNRYIVNVSNAFTAWDNAVADLNATVGLGEKFENLTGKVNESKDKHNELKEVLVGPDGLIDAMKEEVNQVNDVTSAYAKQRKELLALIKIKEDEAKKLEDKKETVANSEEPTNTALDKKEEPEAPTTTGSQSESDQQKAHDDKTKRGVALAIWNGGYGWGDGSTRKSRLKEKGFDPSEIQNLVNNTNPNGNWRSRYGISDLSQYAYSKFDTGGYTGAWGSYGKFAMLHEKELVLNKGDTENFLASMEFLDNIVKTIDLQAMNSSLGGLLNSPAIGGIGSNETLEQMVTIEANFPGVQNRSEIEEAFTTLINQASQYANRK